MKQPAFRSVFAQDPALVRLITSVITITSMALVFFAEWLFVNAFGPLGSTPSLRSTSRATLALHHEVLILAMLVGALLAMMNGLSFEESTIRGTLIASVLPAFPLLATTFITLLLSAHPLVVLALTPFLLGAGTMFRKYGSRGASVGLLMYVGGFFGYLLGATFGLKAFGWFCAEVVVAIGVIAIVRSIALKFQAGSELTRAIYSYSSRANRLREVAREALLDSSEKTSDRLGRASVQLNEMALILEAYLSKKTVPTAESARRILFDYELSLSNLARFAGSIAKSDLAIFVKRDIADFVTDLQGSDPAATHKELSDSLIRWQSFLDPGEITMHIILARLVTSIENLEEASSRWLDLKEELVDLRGTGRPAQSSVPNTLTHVAPMRSGFLTGSAAASASASQEPWSTNTKSLVGLSPEFRSSIQITIATLAATGLGYAIDPQRFYWASLSALLCFMGVNNAGEQVRKAFYRFGGTVIGVILGSLITRAIGLNPLIDVAVILATMFFAVYLFRVNYTFLAAGVTIAISITLLQLNELTGALLLTRVIETTAGALVASATAIFVLPLGPRRVIDTARAKFLESVSALLASVIGSLAQGPQSDSVLQAARELDSAHQSLLAVIGPLQWSMLGSLNIEVGHLIARSTAVRNYSRSLLQDTQTVCLDRKTSETIGNAARKMTASINQLLRPVDRNYTRTSSDLERLRVLLDAQGTLTSAVQLLLRDLSLIDGALAYLAETMGAKVESSLESLSSMT